MSAIPQVRKRAALHTLGCRLNQAETGLIAERLTAAGYELVPFSGGADLGIINTCTVTGEADAKSRKLIRSFIRRNPGAFVAVIGCYSQVGADALAQIEGIDLIVGAEQKLNVLDYVREGKNGQAIVVGDRPGPAPFTIKSAGDSALTTRTNLKIQDGCDFMCSYCIVPYARGHARSRELDNLLGEARKRVDNGTREIVLTGINIGLYDYEGQGILDVVDRLNEIPGLTRIRISSIESTLVPEGLFERMNDLGHALTPFLHVPLQSGSDRVLTAMGRNYTRQEFIDFVRVATEAVDGLCVGTDVLVGMPGERDCDFDDTCALIENAPICYAHVFKYSERAGTPAASMPHKVDPRMTNLRSEQLRSLSEAKREMFHEKHIGRTLDVLFEQAEDGFWLGYTGNYIRVAARSEENLENCIRKVAFEEPRGERVLGTIIT